jgi:hypothetical protein
VTRLNRWRVTCGALASLLISEPLTAQSLLPYRAQLHVSLVWMNPVYGDQHVLGQGMVLRGEPLVLNVAHAANWRQRAGTLGCPGK